MKRTFLVLVIFLCFVGCGHNTQEKTEYYEDGSIKTRTIVYDDLGKRDVLQYLKTGKIHTKYQWYNNLGEGELRTFYKGGGIKESFYLKGGKINGKASKYYSTGEKLSDGNFEDGNLKSSVFYDKNGIIYNVVDGSNEILFQYYEDTTLYEENYLTSVFSINGEKISMKQDSCIVYNTMGKLVLKWVALDSQSKLYIYNKDGFLEDELSMRYDVFVLRRKEYLNIGYSNSLYKFKTK